jgi:hypothetical protein
VLSLSVHTVTNVFWRANYCVTCEEGGPSVSSSLNSSGWVESRRWFSKQLLNCQTIKTTTGEMLKLTNLYAVTTRGRCHCFNVVVGLEWLNDYGNCADVSVAFVKAFNARQVTGDDPGEKEYAGFLCCILRVVLKHKSIIICSIEELRRKW